MTGKELKERYPFLIPRNRWTGEVCPLEPDDDPSWYENWTELDEMPTGWRKAFGEQMCEEIRGALLKSGGEMALNLYRVVQIKEKFGSLRWYDLHSTPEVEAIIRKYEDLSERTCILCGEPATKVSKGWISPFCDSCAEKLERESGINFVPLLD